MFNLPSAPKILVTRLSAHGDVVQTLPLLSALKAAWPQCRIGWLVEAAAAPLLHEHPLIDRLHISHRKNWSHQAANPLHWPTIWQEANKLREELRAERYDVSLDVQGLLKSAIWPWWAGIPNRLGNAKARENASLLYTHRLPPHPISNTTVSAISKYLEFATALGCPPDLPEVRQPHFVMPSVPADRQAYVNQQLSSLIPEYPTLVLAPATVWPTKHWLAEYWSTLIHQLVSMPVNLILIGAPGDQALVDQILQPVQDLSTAQNGRILNLVGQTELADLYALFQRANIVIGPDSAPLHIANAVAGSTGQPAILGLFGPTAPGRTGPIGEMHHTLTTQLSCQPCFRRTCPLRTHDCMTQLTPDHVLTTLKPMLEALCPTPNTP